MRRIFVQGDRDAKGIEPQVRELGALCNERGIGINVGESGEIVRILSDCGADVRVHHSKAGEEPNVPDVSSVRTVDCVRPAAMAAEHLRQQSKVVVPADRIGWGIRLAVLAESDGFIFFPGREGTLAHLIPILAFLMKGVRDAEVQRPLFERRKRSRHVALVGWNSVDTSAILNLFSFGLLRSFSLDQIGAVLDWVAAGFPMEGAE